MASAQAEVERFLGNRDLRDHAQAASRDNLPPGETRDAYWRKEPGPLEKGNSSPLAGEVGRGVPVKTRLLAKRPHVCLNTPSQPSPQGGGSIFAVHGCLPPRNVLHASCGEGRGGVLVQVGIASA